MMRSGLLEVICEGPRRGKRNLKTLVVVCDCGNIKAVRKANFLLGHPKSCGCRENATKHGHGRRNNRSKEYRVWMHMRDRCNNEKNINYANYGGRGITICPEWDSFETFFNDMKKCPPGLTLERIRNNEGYSKENCKWATRIEQGRNQRTNTHLTAHGETKVLAVWAEELCCDSTAILYHLRNKKSMEWIVNHFTEKGGPDDRS